DLTGDPGVQFADAERQKNWPLPASGPGARALQEAAAKVALKGDKWELAINVISRILANGEPLQAAAQAVLDSAAALQSPPAKPDWKALATHKAVEFLAHIKLKGEHNGLWDQGDSAAKKYAVNGRVYQEAYKGQWVSYELAARARRLTSYQFRAPGEWFA